MSDDLRAAEIQPVDSLTVLLTSACNLECRYCYRQAGAPRNLGWPDLRRSLDWALASPGEELELIFSGGEPLLAFETLGKGITFVRDPGREGRAVKIRVLTNGLLLDPGRLDFLVRNSVFVNLSFDGVASAQADRGEGTWGFLDRMLERVMSTYPEWAAGHLQVTMTLTPQNLESMADSVAYLIGRGVGGIGVSPVLTNVPGWDADRWDDLDEQLGRIFDQSLRHLDETGPVPFLPFRKYREMRLPLPRKRKPCAAMEGRNPVLDVGGDFSSCLMFAPSGLDQARPRRTGISRDLDLGRTDDRDFELRRNRFQEDIRNKDIFRSAPDLSSRYRKCGGCPASNFCKVCPLTLLELGTEDSPTRVPALLCAYNQLMVHYHQAFPVQEHPSPPQVTVDSLASRMAYWDSVHEKIPGS